MKKIFILSTWRSGTSWLEDILGKKLEGARLFGHEQQILPLFAMYKECFLHNPLSMRQKANKPYCDITKDNFYEELGLKQHKVLANASKWSKEEFRSFALRLMDVFIKPYEGKFKQIVEKSPENGSPKVFNCAVELFSDIDDYVLIYLVRNFRPYLASCYQKFIKRGKNNIDYYTNKWLEWNTNAINILESNNAKNIFVISYEDLVNNPGMVEKFCAVWKSNTEIRENVLTKWQHSLIINEINDKYDQHEEAIKTIETFVSNRKI